MVVMEIHLAGKVVQVESGQVIVVEEKIAVVDVFAHLLVGAFVDQVD